VIIGFETGFVPPNINYTSPRNDIEALINGTVRVVQEPLPLKNGYIGISSFGIGGANAHMLLKWNLKQKVNNSVPNDELPRLVILSGRTEESVKLFLNDIANYQIDVEYIRLLHDIHSDNIDGHTWRGYIILNTSQQESIQEIKNCNIVKRPVCFIFSALGSQWPGMGQNLLKFQVFANTIRMCDAVLKPYNISITNILTNAEQNVYEDALCAFLGIVAIQIGLVDLLRSLGITPNYMISHSASELGCAYADDCLTIEQTIISAYFIGLACVKGKLIRSSMAIISFDYKCLKNICPEDIEIVCRNSENSSIVSGPTKSVQAFIKKLQVNTICVKEIHCNVPYHSSYLASVEPQLLSDLNKIIPRPKKRSPKWISTSVPRTEWHTSASKLSSADYHTGSILNTVLFDQAKHLIPSNAVTIEIAPNGVLQQVLEKSLHPQVTNILLTQYTEQSYNVIFQGIGRLYNCGLQPQVANLYPPVSWPVSRGTKSTIANIISYHFDLKGPSYVVDTGCSSSLYAMAVGYDYIMSGICEDAIIGASNLCFLPGVNLQYARLGALSPDGYCRPFDIAANGYSRAETVSVAYLQKMKNAKRIYAICPHIKLNSDGYKENGIIYPSSFMQSTLLTELYNECGIPTSCLDYVEAHGTGTKVGDVQEINAIHNTLCKNRKTPLMIGSVKSNLGHGESTSGFIQIAKKGDKILIHSATGGIGQAAIHVALSEGCEVFTTVGTIDKRNFIKQMFPTILDEHIGSSRDTSFEQMIMRQTKEEHMTTRDIYKELKLRGYQYSGLFRGLKSASISGKNGHIIWRNNWVTFMDNMLQMYIIGCDTRDLYVSTSIQKLVINPELHAMKLRDNYANDLEATINKDKQLPIRIYREIDTIIAGGIEIRGLKASQIARRKIIQDAVIEEHVFIAHCDRAKISLNEAIRISAQLALEDHQIIKMKIIELVEDDDDIPLEYLSSSLFLEAFNDMPLIQAKIILLTSPNHFNSSDLTQNISIVDLNRESIDDKALIVTGFNLLTKRQTSLQRLLSFLKEGGYLLTREKCDITDYKKYLQQYELNVILEKRTDKEMVVLLKKKVLIENRAVVYINNDNFNWLEDLKLLVSDKRELDKNSRTIIVGEGDFECGLLGFINCLRKEPDGELVRGVLIQDEEATKFSLQDSFYLEQLQKDMAINVLRPNKTWGSYRHLRLPQREAELVPTAHVYQTVRGDLNTFCWIENNLFAELCREDLVHVIYSSLNFKDVLLATGKFVNRTISHGRFSDCEPFGMEYVGFDANGQRVMGFRDTKCIANVVVKDKDFCWKIPDAWTFEEAATIPCVYSTVYLALYIYGKMLVSRTEIKNGYQRMKVRLWKSYGVNVLIIKDIDVANTQDCEYLLQTAEKEGPVDAIFNLGMAYKSGILKNQTAETFAESFQSKAQATQILDKLTRNICLNLRHFVVFSSVSCGRGSIGLTNYGMANSVMERVCEKRAKEELPGLAIQWGAVGDVGLIADKQEEGIKLTIDGTLQQKISCCLDKLDEFLLQSRPIVSSMVIDEKKAESCGSMVETIASILDIKDMKVINQNSLLAELGVDSMMVIEIKQTLEREFDIFFTAREIRNLSFAKLMKMSDGNVSDNNMHF
ncbi:PREDICTED: fatty acid synthase-like, partial [Wasmannia auropunctata]|uniref:fatty acid synthase-like n=1 Tax=Wasmannia auropunctata TaxID=64793 RepID=UPI0005EE1673